MLMIDREGHPSSAMYEQSAVLPGLACAWIRPPQPKGNANRPPVLQICHNFEVPCLPGLPRVRVYNNNL